MSCLGIDVSSTVQGSELEHITVEGIEATDALGRAICQSQLTVRCEGVAPLNLDLKLSPDDLEPVFSGAAWAGTVLWRAAAVLVDRAFLGADAVQIKGRTCIELGCGLGVPGMACARLGAKNVALTEQQLDLCGNQWRGIYSRHRADAVAGTTSHDSRRWRGASKILISTQVARGPPHKERGSQLFRGGGCTSGLVPLVARRRRGAQARLL